MKTIGSRWARGWFFGAIAISAICLAVTLFKEDLRVIGAPRILRAFNLTGENTIGAWWSGTLLLLAALHAFDGYFSRKALQPRLAYAWASLGLVLLCLSADEVGSFHERVGGNSWLPLLPFAIILGSAWMFAFVTFWRSPEERAKALWIALAFFLLASVAGQEYLEHNTNWWGVHRGFRALVEEGTEIVALLILLRVTMSQSGGKFRSDASPAGAVFQALEAWRTPIVVAALVLTPVLALMTIATLSKFGEPVTWLAGAFFLLAGLTLARPHLLNQSRPEHLTKALVLLCTLMSVVAVALSPTTLPRRSHVISTVLLLAIWALWIKAAAHTTNRQPVLMLAVCGAATLGLTWLETHSLVLTYAAYTFAAISVFYAHAFLNTQSPVMALARPAPKFLQGQALQ